MVNLGGTNVAYWTRGGIWCRVIAPGRLLDDTEQRGSLGHSEQGLMEVMTSRTPGLPHSFWQSPWQEQPVSIHNLSVTFHSLEDILPSSHHYSSNLSRDQSWPSCHHTTVSTITDLQLTTSNHKLALSQNTDLKQDNFTQALDYYNKYKHSGSLLRQVHDINNSNLKRGQPQAFDCQNNTKRELRSNQTSTLPKQYSKARSEPPALV